MLHTLAFVCLENLTLYSVCRSWERVCLLKRRCCSTCGREGPGGTGDRERRWVSLETSPRGLFSAGGFHVPRTAACRQKRPPPPPPPPCPERRGGSGVPVAAGPRGSRRLGTGASRGRARRHRSALPAARAAGQEREEPPLVVPSPPPPPGDEHAPGTVTRGTAGSRRGGHRPRGTPRRNTGRVWGLRFSPLPAGRSGFSRLFHTVTLPSRRRASRVISSSCLVRG